MSRGQPRGGMQPQKLQVDTIMDFIIGLRKINYLYELMSKSLDNCGVNENDCRKYHLAF